jgi:hypothetical protein
MRLTLALLAHELRVQRRSLRFRLVVLLYLVLSFAPPILVVIAQRQTSSLLGGATYAAELATLQPLLVAIVGLLLSLDGVLRESGEGQWGVITLAPVSNTGYLLRRWLAIVLIVLFVSALPPLATLALTRAVGTPAPPTGSLLLPWLCGAAPAAIASTACGLTAGVIVGGEVTGLIALALFTVLVPAGLNSLLAHGGRRLTGPDAMLGIAPLMVRIDWYRIASDSELGLLPVLPATQGPTDPRAAWSAASGTLLFGLAVAAASLALAPAFLARCRRDLPPWRIAPNHPLRTLLTLLNRLRQRLAPDAGLATIDRGMIAAAPLVLLLATLAWWQREHAYRGDLLEAYQAETKVVVAPTPRTIAPVRWDVAGSITKEGAVNVTLQAAILNRGGRPEHHLAFSLSPSMRLLGARAESGRLVLTRSWDRLGAELDPPLAPGERRALVFTLAGTPRDVEFALPSPRNSFAYRADRELAGRLTANLRDLSLSWSRRHAGPRLVDLAAEDLFPVPRYTEWTLTPAPSSPGAPGLDVPAEVLSPLTAMTFDLEVPATGFYAEPCGARVGGAARRLRGSCRIPLDQWCVLGGGLVGISDRPFFAALPAHRERAELHLATLRSIPELAAEAWPGLAIGAPLLIEWPPRFDPDPREGMGSYSPWTLEQGPIPDARGRLLLVPERLIAAGRRIAPESLASDLVAGNLLGRRAIVPDQEVLVRELIAAVVRRRVGLGPSTGAVLIALDSKSYRFPLIGSATFYPGGLAEPRLVALVADLEHRLGAATLRRGIETFLARRDAGPGTVGELMTTLGAVSGASLDRVTADYFMGDAIPQVGLADVHESGSGPWEVSGDVENIGTGEARCPLRLETDTDPVETEVRIEGGKSTRFTLRTTSPPRRITVDPDQQCLRFRPRVAGPLPERVELHAEARR